MAERSNKQESYAAAEHLLASFDFATCERQPSDFETWADLVVWLKDGDS